LDIENNVLFQVRIR